MTRRYVVVLFEDGTLNATVVGPFRSEARAEHEVRLFERVEDGGDRELPSGLGAQVVALDTGASVRRRIRERLR